jgi:hypothetical protein
LQKWVERRRIFRALSARFKGKTAMGYHLYYTEFEILEAQYRANKLLLLSYAYNELDGALRKARKIRERGGVPWEIECDDGRVIRRYEIAKLVREREAELLDSPEVH